MTSIRQKNQLPFLHRNWIKVTNHWNTIMGNKASLLARESADKVIDLENPQLQRPVKRRRLNNDYDGIPVQENYVNSPRKLRIEILKINHKDTPRVKNGVMNGIVAPPDVRDIKGRCKISIAGHKGGEQNILHVDSQLCDLKVFKNPASSTPMARLSAIKPFEIPEEKIYLERDGDAGFGLAEAYTVTVELESAGDPKWPPRDLLPRNGLEDVPRDGDLPPRLWVLTASIPDIYEPQNRKTIRLRMRKQPQHERLTDYRVEVDVRWLTNISTQHIIKEKNIMPSINVYDQNEPLPPQINNIIDLTNGSDISPVNGHVADDLVNVDQDAFDKEAKRIAMDNQAEGLLMVIAVEKELVGEKNIPPECTEIADDFFAEYEQFKAGISEGQASPNRAKRVRPDINYNVKQLWNSAVGKEPRKRRRADTENSNQLDEHTITYSLPPEQFRTDKLECLLCGAAHERFSQLRAHYLNHPEYEFKFHLDARARGAVVTASPSRNNLDAPFRRKVYQLGLPMSSLDLDKYVEGDESWVTSRLGPQDGLDIGGAGQKPPQGRAPAKRVIKKPARKVVLVPKIKQPLFDALSKKELKAGTEVRQHEIDDSWLIAKHRDNLLDFTDVTNNEKEYMVKWDAFILKKHISSQAYLPRAFSQFVKEKAAWIVSEKHKNRAVEFSKHASMLLLRQVIDEPTLHEATQFLNEARANEAKRKETAGPGIPEEEPEPPSAEAQTAVPPVATRYPCRIC
ncbi:hypothetical protein B0T17DRAFT_16741 [Bombardia bombarda]|uniref:Polycomb protein VEFS-Box domain-containing protein n=1 Tax=Bombardia bombarda TaxID=252184 RepID=A0AA40CES9_9PEZI|nr:hypothetical protein B0T17DRAFT_16741 [Bombardia bombarda]